MTKRPNLVKKKKQKEELSQKEDQQKEELSLLSPHPLSTSLLNNSIELFLDYLQIVKTYFRHFFCAPGFWISHPAILEKTRTLVATPLFFFFTDVFCFVGRGLRPTKMRIPVGLDQTTVKLGFLKVDLKCYRQSKESVQTLRTDLNYCYCHCLFVFSFLRTGGRIPNQLLEVNFPAVTKRRQPIWCFVIFSGKKALLSIFNWQWWFQLKFQLKFYFGKKKLQVFLFRVAGW